MIESGAETEEHNYGAADGIVNHKGPTLLTSLLRAALKCRGQGLSKLIQLLVDSSSPNDVKRVIRHDSQQSRNSRM
jgi:hypothetical protein